MLVGKLPSLMSKALEVAYVLRIPKVHHFSASDLRKTTNRNSMIAYASRTGTRQNLDFLRKNGWRLMISAKGAHRDEGFGYAIDNGAWTAFQKKQPFDSEAFERILETHGKRADFIVIPDIVCGGLESLEFSKLWLNRLTGCYKLVLISVQDGMKAYDVEPMLRSGIGLFIGGSDRFKEESMGEWSELARKTGSVIHCGRVNSRRRLKLCQMHGIDSFDGSGPSRFLKHARVMNAELSQQVMEYA
jgi:hypothetical protein